MLNAIHIVRKLDDKARADVQRVVDRINMCTIDLNKLMGQYIRTNDPIDDNTLIIGIGGDGTMLQAMQLSAIYGGTAMGINLGRVGFLSDFVLHDALPRTLCEIFEQEKKNIANIIGPIPSHYPLEARMGLQINYPDITLNPSKPNMPPLAFNEFVLSEKYSDTMIEYHLKIGDMDAGYHRANGLIIATPTGSTAYSLSAGGALVIPSIDIIQLVPVAPATMTSRPIIIDARSTIIIEVANNSNVVLRADGQPVFENEWKEQTRIAISAAVVRAKLIHPPKWNFFEMLSKKLGWQHG